MRVFLTGALRRALALSRDIAKYAARSAVRDAELQRKTEELLTRPGAVAMVSQDVGELAFEVQSSSHAGKLYHVSLQAASCDCPANACGQPCKHLVACRKWLAQFHPHLAAAVSYYRLEQVDVSDPAADGDADAPSADDAKEEKQPAAEVDVQQQEQVAAADELQAAKSKLQAALSRLSDEACAGLTPKVQRALASVTKQAAARINAILDTRHVEVTAKRLPHSLAALQKNVAAMRPNSRRVRVFFSAAT